MRVRGLFLIFFSGIGPLCLSPPPFTTPALQKGGPTLVLDNVRAIEIKGDPHPSTRRLILVFRATRDTTFSFEPCGGSTYHTLVCIERGPDPNQIELTKSVTTTKATREGARRETQFSGCVRLHATAVSLQLHKIPEWRVMSFEV